MDVEPIPDRAPPCAVVLFGATGDLARSKLFPALRALHRRGLLHESTIVVGCSRSVEDDRTLRAEVREIVDGDQDFLERVVAARVDLDAPPDTALEELVRRLGGRARDGNILFHLATPADRFAKATSAIAAAGLAEGTGWRRLLVEKPFGSDAASAGGLDRRLREVFDEQQIHRVDHFLGKDAVQNLLVFRGMNVGPEAVWNREFVDHVQITVAERAGLGQRASFYESTGVVRDMLQSHLLVLLALTTMDLPDRATADSLHDAAHEILARTFIEDPDRDVVLGQYGPGRIGTEPVPGYAEEEGVDASTTVPTFVAARLRVDGERWRDVPFYLRTGKRMPRDFTEVVVQFRSTPARFEKVGMRRGNRLVFRVKPDCGIARSFWVKVPGHENRFEQVEMCCAQAAAFDVQDPPGAYEHVFYDAMTGDRLLFPRREEILESWRIVAPLLEAEEDRRPEPYAAGTFGPPSATAMLTSAGREWHVGARHAAQRVGPLLRE